MTMKIHFTSSNSKEAISLKSKYSELYNQANLREADVIVAIGGDGEMLKALRLAIKNNSSVFGLNKGHIGFLMNKINKTNLIKRINKASQLTTDMFKTMSEFFARLEFNSPVIAIILTFNLFNAGKSAKISSVSPEYDIKIIMLFD